MTTRSLVRLFVVAAVVPAAIMFCDRALLERQARNHTSILTTAALYAFFVVQVALLSILVGRYIERPWLKWLVFAWLLAAIDVLIFTRSMHILNWYNWQRSLGFVFGVGTGRTCGHVASLGAAVVGLAFTDRNGSRRTAAILYHIACPNSLELTTATVNGLWCCFFKVQP